MTRLLWSNFVPHLKPLQGPPMFESMASLLGGKWAEAHHEFVPGDGGALPFQGINHYNFNYRSGSQKIVSECILTHCSSTFLAP